MTEPNLELIEERFQLRQRIYDLERQLRSVQLYGVGYLLKHGKDQMQLHPWDVTVVLPAGQPTTELELRSLASELEGRANDAETALINAQERIRKVREMAEAVSKYDDETRLDLARDVLAVLDGEVGPLATGGVVTQPIPISQGGCAFPKAQIPVGATIHVPDGWKALMPMLDGEGEEKP